LNPQRIILQGDFFRYEVIDTIRTSEINSTIASAKTIADTYIEVFDIVVVIIFFKEMFFRNIPIHPPLVTHPDPLQRILKKMTEVRILEFGKKGTDG
jgi:hypothetical protein